MTVTIHKKADYQDIREELRKRVSLLESLAAKEQTRFEAEQEKAAAAHKKAMDSYKIAIASYRDMLTLEESFSVNMLAAQNEVGPKQENETVKINLPAPKVSLAEFFVKTLAETGPMNKDELRQVALDAGYEIDGRHTHATLVNLTRNQRIKPASDNKYVVNELEKALL